MVGHLVCHHFLLISIVIPELSFLLLQISGLLASYEKTTWTFDDVCCLNSRVPLRGLYVSKISRYCLWTANGGLCQCDGGGGLGTKDSVREQNLCEGVRQ